jgi:hypothetical protein
VAELRTVVTDRGSRWQIGLGLGDTVVSGLGVVKKQMQIGSVAVKMGGIAGVWTDQNHRMKGYASQAMWESIALMERKNCDMSILFGIADFYHRYGFAVAFAGQSMQVATAQLLRLGGSLRVRAKKKLDFAAMRRLYKRYNAGRSGMDARPSNWNPRWYMPRLGEGAKRRAGRVLVVCDRRDRLCGFAVYDAQVGRTLVTEVCGRDRKALASLGVAIGRRGKREGSASVQFQLPVDDPFVALCVPMGCICSVSHPFNTGAMGRIICLDRLMKKLLPEFRKRRAGSDVKWTGDLTIATDIGRVGFQISKANVSLIDTGKRAQVSMSQVVLTQLVMGYRSAAEVAADEGVKISKGMLPVLDMLFPKGNPYMWWTDRF